ncbi:MAG: hypothetical protein ABIH18_09520 [Candidatus Omnitrophota bacterium]
MSCFREKIQDLKNKEKEVVIETIKESPFKCKLEEIGDDYIVVNKDKIINMNSIVYIKEWQQREKPGIGYFGSM